MLVVVAIMFMIALYFLFIHKAPKRLGTFQDLAQQRVGGGAVRYRCCDRQSGSYIGTFLGSAGTTQPCPDEAKLCKAAAAQR